MDPGSIYNNFMRLMTYQIKYNHLSYLQIFNRFHNKSSILASMFFIIIVILCNLTEFLQQPLLQY